jgi:hypothetical protein
MIFRSLFEHIKFARPQEFAAAHHSIGLRLRVQGAIVACTLQNDVDLSLYCTVELRSNAITIRLPSAGLYSPVKFVKIDPAQTNVPSYADLAF